VAAAVAAARAAVTATGARAAPRAASHGWRDRPCGRRGVAPRPAGGGFAVPHRAACGGAPHPLCGCVAAFLHVPVWHLEFYPSPTAASPVETQPLVAPRGVGFRVLAARTGGPIFMGVCRLEGAGVDASVPSP